MPDWFVADSDDRVEPSGPKKAQGWQPQEPFPAQNANWLWYSVSLWIAYLVELVEDEILLDLGAVETRLDGVEASVGGFDGRIDDLETEVMNSPNLMTGLGLNVSASNGALTVTTKQADGVTDLSAANPLKIAFRSRAPGVGGYTVHSIPTSESLVIPSGATLGYISATGNKQVFIYQIYDGTNIELAVSSHFFKEATLVSTTALDASSNSLGVLYSTNARTDCAIRFLGVAEYNGAAGTYVTPDTVAVGTHGLTYAAHVWSLTHDFEATSSTAGGWGGANSFSTWAMENKSYDLGDNYATSGIYTAPYSGIYQFGAMGTSANQDIESAGDEARASLFVNGVERRVIWYDEVDDPNSARSWCAHGVVQIELNQGDQVTVRGNQVHDAATNRIASAAHNWFWGRMIRRL